jgi:sigma-E factor negative regulatory protein RseC
MTRTVLVKEVFENGLCKVEIKRESACGGNCSSCGGCISADRTAAALAVNSVGASAGDTVVVESRGKDIFIIAALVYILPVVLLIAGYVVAASLSAHAWAPGIGSALGFAAGILTALVCERRRKGKIYLTVTKILRENDAN